MNKPSIEAVIFGLVIVTAALGIYFFYRLRGRREIADIWLRVTTAVVILLFGYLLLDGIGFYRMSTLYAGILLAIALGLWVGFGMLGRKS